MTLAEPQNRLLPVTIVTGFLGSGKTTLLNHILHSYQDLKIAVLVNEFGDINIDSQLLIDRTEDTIELSNGCICCTINNDLVETVYRIICRTDPIDYLIIETTGLADPLPIALVFLGTELRSATRLDSILTVLDADNIDSSLYYNSELAIKQLIYGDIVILNKVDLVPPELLTIIEHDLRTIKQGARIIRSEFCNVPLSSIVDLDIDRHDWDLSIASKPADLGGFKAISFKSDRPFSTRKFQQFLDTHLPISIVRAKGILWFAEDRNRHIFQLSGRRFTFTNSTWQASPSNQMVLIGHSLNALEIQQLLNNCLTHVSDE